MITGLGCVTPCGIGVRDTWDAIVSGRSGTKEVSTFDATGCASRVAGEIRDFNPGDFLAQRDCQTFARFVHFGVAAARMAWEDAGSPLVIGADRIGVCVGSAVGAIGRAITDGITFFEKGIQRVHPMFSLQYPGSYSSQIAIEFGLHGPAYAVGTACTAGADAIGLALGQIQSGMIDAAVVGGSDAPIFPLLFASFDRIGALSKCNDPAERASRPFSRERTGFVLSEGSAALVLEAEDVALARGASMYAELAGFGASCDGFHHLAPDPEGRQGARAINQALKHAGISAAEVDYVNAHGTSTLKNDVMETQILKQVLGPRAHEIPISSSKSMLGHMIGASGPIELLISALALRHGIVPPTINFVERDPECDLDYVTEGARHQPLRTVLSTSFGFGSRNAALVLKALSS